jgi:hypothetical protein
MASEPDVPPQGEERRPDGVPRWVVPAVTGLVVVSAIAIVLLLVSQSGPEPGRYSGRGIAFEYPEDWDLLPEVEPSIAPGSGEAPFVIRIGMQPPLDVVFLSQYDVDQLPPGETMEERLQAALDAFAEDSGLDVVEPIAPYDEPGIEAWTARLGGVGDGTPFQSLVIYLVLGDDLWVVSCESTGPNRAEMEDGCRRIVRTFEPER